MRMKRRLALFMEYSSAKSAFSSFSAVCNGVRVGEKRCRAAQPPPLLRNGLPTFDVLNTHIDSRRAPTLPV